MQRSSEKRELRAPVGRRAVAEENGAEGCFDGGAHLSRDAEVDAGLTSLDEQSLERLAIALDMCER